MSNRLKEQSSPYLLQHAENPVDWYPWGEEAFERAKKENKPIFLSIGYSTCHWCHVMAHESFEDEEIADILNRSFVSIKVDREERPDIDSVYMSVCQELTGSGGWPMSIFMTAEQKPFYAGTYFPPVSRYGMLGFRDVLLLLADKWENRKAELLESAEQILSHVNSMDGTGMSDYKNKPDRQDGSNLDRELPRLAVELFCQSFDKRHGGFGMAPKFPVPHNLLFLMLYFQTEKGMADSTVDGMPVFEMVKVTLEKMRRGGIFDQIGFGFSRYSTDPYYLVPHFEKMLYDNALLILAYAAAYKVSGDRMFLDTAEQTAEYIFREMTGADGEFYSAQDADSEGEEGKYYVWAYEEICGILGKEKGVAFCKHFGITRQGNFEGKNIPNLLNGKDISDDFEKEKKLLYGYRRSRASLHLDDKILTSWNSLTICAMSVLYRVTGKQEYLLAAEKAQRFIEDNLSEENSLYVSCRNRKPSVPGFLDEYATYTAALIHLYEVTEKSYYRERAEQICQEAERQFADVKGGYFLYGSKNGSLITKPKETYDGALPSGNSVMAYCLVRLSQITGEESYRCLAEKQLVFLSQPARQYPTAHSLFMIALLMYIEPPQKITVVMAGEDRREEILSRLPLYADITIREQETDAYQVINKRTTYYICKDRTCLPPTNQIL